MAEDFENSGSCFRRDRALPFKVKGGWPWNSFSTKAGFGVEVDFDCNLGDVITVAVRREKWLCMCVCRTRPQYNSTPGLESYVP